MILGGADPGFSGAVAFLDIGLVPVRVLGIADMPTAKKRSGRRELLLRELVAGCLQVLDGRPCGQIWIEQMHGFVAAGDGGQRRMGASSAFSLGRCSMAIEMLAAVLGWPTEMVMPGVWKRAFGLGKDKALSRGRASEMLPADAGLWTPRRGYVTTDQANGRAEAALIAVYGMRAMEAIARGAAAA